MNRHFVTYFDRNYCAFGIAMLRSLLRVEPVASATVLCLDELTEQILRVEFGDRIARFSLAELAIEEPRLAAASADRTPWEAYAMLTPLALRWMLRRVAAGDRVVYVDADLGFFSDLAALWDEMGEAAIAISPHRYSAPMRRMARYGTFNAGFVALRNTAEGLRCADDWSDECLAWCHQQCTPDGRYMNQGYLDAWPRRYSSVVCLAHPGHNLGIWNIDSYGLSLTQGRLRIAGQPLLFFHFSGLWCGHSGHWQAWAVAPGMASPLLRASALVPHLREINIVATRLKARHGDFGLGSVKRRIPSSRSIALPLANPEGLVLPSRTRQWWRYAIARLAALLRHRRLAKPASPTRAT